jgi:site-specific recombinase XerD
MTNALSVVNEFNHAIQMVLDSVSSKETKRKYYTALRDFMQWYDNLGQPGLNKAAVQRYITELQEQGMGISSINQRVSAIRKLAGEAAEIGLVDPMIAQGIKNVKGMRSEGKPVGQWLTKAEAQALIRKPDISTNKGLRDRAILCVFIGCGLRRSEAANLQHGNIQQRDDRWVIVDIVGKRNKVRSVPMPSWCKAAIDAWTECKPWGEFGYVFTPISKGDTLAGGMNMTDQALYYVVTKYSNLNPRDLRRTFAMLARKGGAELTQIQLSLGHTSVSITQDYINEDQNLSQAPCDLLGLTLM